MQHCLGEIRKKETQSVLPNGGDTVLRSVLINPVSYLVFNAWGFLYPVAETESQDFCEELTF